MVVSLLCMCNIFFFFHTLLEVLNRLKELEYNAIYARVHACTVTIYRHTFY